MSFLTNAILAYATFASFLVLGSVHVMTRLALLIFIFLVAGLFFMIIDFYFLGLTYIIVYVGAIAILFLFVIMLINTNATPSQIASFKAKNSLTSNVEE
jgi:NADH-ubiquinone oxidoreductase chain 6